jgi:hypothetical protein
MLSVKSDRSDEETRADNDLRCAFAKRRGISPYGLTRLFKFHINPAMATEARSNAIAPEAAP